MTKLGDFVGECISTTPAAQDHFMAPGQRLSRECERDSTGADRSKFHAPLLSFVQIACPGSCRKRSTVSRTQVQAEAPQARTGPERSPWTLPPPVASDPPPVPPHHCLRPHHLQGISPTLPEPGHHDPEDPIHSSQPWPRLARLPHGELLSKREVLQRQLAVGANGGPQ